MIHTEVAITRCDDVVLEYVARERMGLGDYAKARAFAREHRAPPSGAPSTGLRPRTRKWPSR